MLLQVTFQYLFEDIDHGGLAKIGHPYHIEVSEKTGGNWLAAASWRCTCHYEASVEDLLELVVVEVVEPFAVYSLPQQLYWRLGEVTVSLRHVHIIDEGYHFFTRFGAQFSLCFFIKFGFEEVFKVIGLSLSGEVHVARLI